MIWKLRTEEVLDFAKWWKSKKLKRKPKEKDFLKYFKLRM